MCNVPENATPPCHLAVKHHGAAPSSSRTTDSKLIVELFHNDTHGRRNGSIESYK
jgi:hypothetical protein